ncbi:MAG: ABC transporter permease, partial [Gemmatimonadales bacterium]
MSSHAPRRPPWLADLLLRLTLPSDPVGQSILGDLRSEHADASPLDAKSRPGWYWRQALGVSGRYGWRKMRLAAGLPPEPDPHQTTAKTKGALFMESIVRDIQYALRSLRKNPGFAAVAILILALGIGANTAIFSVVDAVLLRSLPYPEADRIVRISHGDVEQGFDRGRDFSPQDFEDLRAGSVTLEQVVSYFYWPGSATVNLTGDGSPVQLQAIPVSEDFFTLLGGQAAIGRTFAPDEFVEGQDGVLVLSAGLWRRQFGSDPGVVGRSITLGGMPFTVIGVMPPSFRYPDKDADIWVPMSYITEDMIPSLRHIRWRSVIARLAPGVTVDAAHDEVTAILQRLADEYPDSNEGMTLAKVEPLRDDIVGNSRTALWVLLGATGLVLLISCANVGNLLLARATGRGREIAIRISMGARRSRLARQLMTESIVLAFAGGVAGVALAYISVDVLVAMSAGTIPEAEQIRFDGRLAGFAVAVTAITGVIFGLFPAWQAARIQPQEMLKDGAAGGSRGRFGLQSVLVVAEMALAVMLVSGAGLMIKSFYQLVRVDPGFDVENVLTVNLRVSMDELTSAEVPYRQQAYIDAVAALPGVIAVGGSKTAPLDGGGEPYVFRYVDDNGESRRADPESGLYMVTPGYFEALGIPLLRGRNFTLDDERHVILNEAMARMLWGHTAVAGKYMTLGSTEIEVIGVVGDVHHDGIANEARSAMYALPYAFPRSAVTLYIRTTSDPLAASSDVRRAVWSVDPDQPLGEFATLGQMVSNDVATPRFFTTLLMVFAGVALALAALGIYGVVSYAVGRRTSEMGLRMALGAQSGSLLRLVLGQSMALSLGGLVLGVLGGLGLSGFLSSQL